MRLTELIEGDDGRLDEQPALSIFFGMILGGLMIFCVVTRQVAFDPLNFAAAAATFTGGSCGALTLRSRFGKGQNNAAVSDQPAR